MKSLPAASNLHAAASSAGRPAAVQRPPAPRYDRRTVLLHWATVLLVLALWGTAECIDLFPKGPARYPMRSTHLLLGVIFAGVLLARIAWRWRGRARPPVANPGAADRVARATHLLLYALLVATVLLGLLNTWVRGDQVYGLFQIPALDPGNIALRKVVGGLHHWAAYALLATAGLHAAAALVHHFVFHDRVLQRMSLKEPS